MEDEAGIKHYVKFSKSEAHAKNEVLAAKLYEAAQSPIISSQLVKTPEGKLGTATKWAHDVKLINRNDPAQVAEAQQHFATHAWLANWDAAGLEYDNQGMTGGKMTTLDPGGSLIFRAQGTLKGSAFGNTVGEWDTLRHPSNHQAHRIFGSASKEALKASAAKVASIPNDTVRALVMEHGPGTEQQRKDLAEKLIARKRDIGKRAGVTVVDRVMHFFSRLKDDFNEGDHPREPAGSASGGQFTSGGGGGGGGSIPAPASTAHYAASIPSPVAKSVQGHWPTKVLVQKVKHALESGTGLEEAKTAIKAYHDKYTDGSFKSYAKKLLSHVQSAEGGAALAKPVAPPSAPASPPPSLAQPAGAQLPSPPTISLSEMGKFKAQQIHSIAVSPSTSLPAKLEQLNNITSTNPTIVNYKTKIIATLQTNPALSAPPVAQSPIAQVQAIKMNANLTAAEKMDQINAIDPGGDTAAKNFKASILAELGAGSAPPKPKIPAPYPGSKGQEMIHKIATDPILEPADMIAEINKVLANSSVTGPSTQKYGAEVKQIIQPGPAPAPTPTPKPASPAAPTPTPAPAPAPKTKFESANQKLLARGKALHARAIHVANAGESKAVEATITMDRNWWKKNATAEQRAAVKQYKEGSGAINGYLRSPEAHIYGKAAADLIDELYEHDDAIVKQDVLVRRGENVSESTIKKWQEQLQKGFFVRPQKSGNISTSMASTPAMHRNVTFEIVVRKGHRALGFWANDPSFNTENELNLRHGTVWDIHEIEQVGSKWIVRGVTL
jgi:hypothetical protein